jgi:hypothetical protein
MMVAATMDEHEQALGGDGVTMKELEVQQPSYRLLVVPVTNPVDKFPLLSVFLKVRASSRRKLTPSTTSSPRESRRSSRQTIALKLAMTQPHHFRHSRSSAGGIYIHRANLLSETKAHGRDSSSVLFFFCLALIEALFCKPAICHAALLF